MNNLSFDVLEFPLITCIMHNTCLHTIFFLVCVCVCTCVCMCACVIFSIICRFCARLSQDPFFKLILETGCVNTEILFKAELDGKVGFRIR